MPPPAAPRDRLVAADRQHHHHPATRCSRREAEGLCDLDIGAIDMAMGGDAGGLRLAAVIGRAHDRAADDAAEGVDYPHDPA